MFCFKLTKVAKLTKNVDFKSAYGLSENTEYYQTIISIGSRFTKAPHL